jgi:hypothetical protein
MNTTTIGMMFPVTDETTSMSLRQAAMLQLAPGVMSLPVFALLAWILAEQGIPNIFALALTILLVEVPVCWAIILKTVRKENGGQFSFAKAFPWTASIPWWQYLLIGVPLILFSMFMIVGIGPRVEGLLLHNVFAWVPDWFVMRPDPSMFSSLSKSMLMTLWILMFVSMVVVGGVTQEFYSRGFLLPRTQHFGWWAPAFNALLFAIFHLIAPWGWVVFFLMSLPWAYLVWWRRSVKIGLFIHVGMVGLQWLGMTMVMFGFVEMPS